MRQAYEGIETAVRGVWEAPNFTVGLMAIPSRIVYMSRARLTPKAASPLDHHRRGK